MKPAVQFADAYQRSDATPERLAFEIARMAYPALDIAKQLEKLDVLADFVQHELPDEERSTLPAEDFLRVFTQSLDFHGSREAYQDPRNSLLPDVLERRIGLPIMLCLVCMAIGRRLGVQIVGLGMPSHFLALYRGSAGDRVLDPFLGLTLAPDEVERHLARLLGRPVQLAPEVWRPVSPQAMALRILHNLRNAYLTAKDLPMVEHVLDYLIVAHPAEAQYWRERGLLYYRQQRWLEAHYDLRRYLMRMGLLPPSLPSGAPGQPAPTPAAATQGDQRVLEFYREASSMLARIN